MKSISKPKILGNLNSTSKILPNVPDKIINDKTIVLSQPKIISQYTDNNEYAYGGAKPKYFLGAALGVAQLGMGIVNSIMQNNAQQKQVDEQNKLTERNDAIQMKQRLDSEGVSARNFGVNTPMTSFYAGGGKVGNRIAPDGQGIQQKTEDMSVAYGARHEQGGVDAGAVEVEGGGGNQPGEVIKQEQDGSQFIFSDRIPIPGSNTTFAQVAQQLTAQKANIEKTIGAKLLDVDHLSISLNKSASIPRANADAHRISNTKVHIKSLEDSKQQIDGKIEQLKQQQLEVGKAAGLYNEDGTPKDTTDQVDPQQAIQQSQNEQQEFAGGGKSLNNILKFKIPSINQFDYLNSNKTKTINPLMDEGNNLFLAKEDYANKYEPINEDINLSGVSVVGHKLSKPNNNNVTDINTNNITPNFGNKLDNFISSNNGQAVMGLANAGLNFASNLATTANMAKLKTAAYIPVKNQDTPLINLSSSRQGVNDSVRSISKFAKDNYSNPQVAGIVTQNAQNNGIDKLGQINQQESSMNTRIIDENINRRMSNDYQNNNGLRQVNEDSLNNTLQNIKNQQTTGAALNKDLGDVLTNYRQGLSEQKMIDLYGHLNPRGVNDLLTLETKYGVNRDDLNNYTSDEDKHNFLMSQGLSSDEADGYIYKSKYASTNFGEGTLYAKSTPKGYAATSIDKTAPKGYINPNNNVVLNIPKKVKGK